MSEIRKNDKKSNHTTKNLRRSFTASSIKSKIVVMSFLTSPSLLRAVSHAAFEDQSVALPVIALAAQIESAYIGRERQPVGWL